MPSKPTRAARSRPADRNPSLTDRVQARVLDARQAVDRKTKASRPKVKRGRAPVARANGNADQQSPEQALESRSLKRVFRDLGTSYRSYRRETGEPVTPALRDAAYNFRAEPSLTSLVSVAVFLDELDILKW
jgi:hypothetical protein